MKEEFLKIQDELPC